MSNQPDNEQTTDDLCPQCDGSGEGCAGGTKCSYCEGSGASGGWKTRPLFVDDYEPEKDESNDDEKTRNLEFGGDDE